MKYVACYCRVSTEEQAKYGFSIQAQKDALEIYCKENNYKYEFYIDEGISASSMKKRKALNKMLNKSNMFDMILFTKLDRLSRNVLDANTINKILIENKCTMKAIDEDDIDTSTADGTFMFNLKVSLAQREIGKTSERINFVFQNKRKNGEITSGSKKFGYNIENNKFVINQEEANKIVNLYNYFIQVNGNIQKSYSYFVQHFEGKGYDAFRIYLRDTAYIGKYKLYRKNIYLDDYIPGIMSEELFNSVQNLIQKRQYNVRKNPKTSLFAGLVYCDNCKTRLIKKQDNRVKNCLIRFACDNVFRYKVGSTERKCNNRNLIREDDLEKYILENLNVELEKYKFRCNITKKIVHQTNPEQIKKIENKIIKLKDLYLDDLIDKETYTRDYTKFKKELENLKLTNSFEEKQDFTKIEQILNSDYLTIYNKLSLDNKRKFWLSIIDKIYILDGKVKGITFL